MKNLSLPDYIYTSLKDDCKYILFESMSLQSLSKYVSRTLIKKKIQLNIRQMGRFLQYLQPKHYSNNAVQLATN